jgi:chromosome segregation ATPase
MRGVPHVPSRTKLVNSERVIEQQRSSLSHLVMENEDVKTQRLELEREREKLEARLATTDVAWETAQTGHAEASEALAIARNDLELATKEKEARLRALGETKAEADELRASFMAAKSRADEGALKHAKLEAVELSLRSTLKQREAERDEARGETVAVDRRLKATVAEVEAMRKERDVTQASAARDAARLPEVEAVELVASRAETTAALGRAAEALAERCQAESESCSQIAELRKDFDLELRVAKDSLAATTVRADRAEDRVGELQERIAHAEVMHQLAVCDNAEFRSQLARHLTRTSCSSCCCCRCRCSCSFMLLLL